MKVAITGHTKGIGKAIFEEMSSRGHTVLGFSRSNGYDISQLETRNAIISKIQDYDIFVNNAYSHRAQFELLKKITHAWNGLEKIIVNVGSKSIYATVLSDSMKDYVEDKRKQNEFIYQQKLKARPHIINLILGLVETDMSQMFVAKKIQASDVAKLLADVIDIHDKIYVQDLVLDVAYQNWSEIKTKDI